MQIYSKDYLILKNCGKIGEYQTAAPKRYSFCVQDIVDDMRASGEQINIVIVDACRHNVQQRGSGTVANQAVVHLPYQTFIAYSTSPGTGARDGGKEKNSPFAASFLKHVLDENLPIELLFKTIRQEMKAAEESQLPWEHTCLIENFSFNHGQLSQYYDSPYSEDAYKYALSGQNSDIKNLLLSDVNPDVSRGLDIVTKGFDTLGKDDLFLAGRLIYADAYKGNEDCINFLKKFHSSSHINSVKSSDFLSGLYYELYFDGEDKPRKDILCDDALIDIVEKIRSSARDKASERFIRDAIAERNYFYKIGNIHDIKAYITTEESFEMSYEGNPLHIVKTIRLGDGNDVTNCIAWDQCFFTIRDLRECIVRSLCVPHSMLHLKMSKVYDENMVYTCLNVFALGEIIEQLSIYCRNNTPSEVDCLSQLSYIEEIEDINLSDVWTDEFETFIEGAGHVSVCLEFEGESNGSMSFPFKFQTSLTITGGKIKIGESDTKISVDTRKYYT